MAKRKKLKWLVVLPTADGDGISVRLLQDSNGIKYKRALKIASDLDICDRDFPRPYLISSEIASLVESAIRIAQPADEEARFQIINNILQSPHGFQTHALPPR